jgi:hypothetical protein
MTDQLERLISALYEHNIVVGKARNRYLLKEAERKHFESVLVKNAEGKSHSEKVIYAQATNEWLEFHKDLARLESVYEFQKFKLEILEKEWLAEYSSRKSDERQIKRGV